MLNLLADENLRVRFWWPFVLVVAAFAYLYSLGGLHIPNIGDEAPYFQITRLTAESGKWLPLKATEGLENTKPPLLFWQGIVSTNWGKDWSLLRLRLPTVAFTFLVSLLVYLLAAQLGNGREKGYLAALTFLGFSSTFQHGRPFLTNLPETFFLFLPVFLLLYKNKPGSLKGVLLWVVIGISIGIATLYKSVVLIVPIGFSLGWILAVQRRWVVRDILVKDAPLIVMAMLIALSFFALWPLLDPEPQAIVDKFLLKENLGKLGRGNYLTELFSGAYPVYRIWLGNFTNAGLLAVPLLLSVIFYFRNRHGLSTEEKVLWIFILGFLVVYTVPSQRQENYLLPTVPALAVLIGLKWDQLRNRSFYISYVPIALVLLLFSWLIFSLRSSVLPTDSYQMWHLLLPVIGLAIIVFALIHNKVAAHLFHLTVFLGFLSYSAVLMPFEGPLGRYSQLTVSTLEGKTVYIPSNFGVKYDRHRFFMPNINIKGYSFGDEGRQKELLHQGQIVAINLPYNTDNTLSRYEVYGSRLDVRSRLKADEVKKVLFDGRLDLLIQKEIIVQKISSD